MQRVINILIILTSWLGYLEWGGSQSAFLIEVEWLLLSGQSASASDFAHPIIFLPLTGQVLGLIALLQKKPSRRLTTIGLVLIAILLLLVVVVGLISLNLRIFGSTLPFFVVSIWHLRGKQVN